VCGNYINEIWKLCAAAAGDWKQRGCGPGDLLFGPFGAKTGTGGLIFKRGLARAPQKIARPETLIKKTDKSDCGLSNSSKREAFNNKIVNLANSIRTIK